MWIWSLSQVISFDSFDFQKRKAKCKFFSLLWRPRQTFNVKRCTYLPCNKFPIVAVCFVRSSVKLSYFASPILIVDIKDGCSFLVVMWGINYFCHDDVPVLPDSCLTFHFRKLSLLTRKKLQDLNFSHWHEHISRWVAGLKVLCVLANHAFHWNTCNVPPSPVCKTAVTQD